MNKISIRLVLINLFLVAMLRFICPLGLAFVAPIQDALELNLPSLYEQVGFSILSPIGFSEFAGIYGGLNFCIGVFLLSRNVYKSMGQIYDKFHYFLSCRYCIWKIIFFAFRDSGNIDCQ